MWMFCFQETGRIRRQLGKTKGSSEELSDVRAQTKGDTGV